MQLRSNTTPNSGSIRERCGAFFGDKPLLVWRVQVGAMLLFCLWGFADHARVGDDPLPCLFSGLALIVAYLVPTVILSLRIAAANSGKRPLPADRLAQIGLFALQMAASGFIGTGLTLLAPRVPALQFLTIDPCAGLALFWMPVLCAIPLGCLTQSHRFGKWAMVLSLTLLLWSMVALL